MEYTLAPGIPKCETVDEVKITDAPSLNNGKAFCAVK
jgi:hypothetical protein